MIERRLSPRVERVMREFPGITVVRAQQVARDRERLLRKGVPALNAKWIAP